MFYAKRLFGGVGVWLALVGTAVAQPVIQELLYDGPGSDADDVFTEIVGPAGMSLDGWTLVGMNGDTGEEYRTVDLSGAVMPADGVLVVATASAAGALLAQRDWVGSVDWQNGPDGVQLRDPQGVVVDALQYGDAGAFNQGEGTPASLVSAGASLGRDAVSTDTGDNATDFAVLETPTPGVLSGGSAPQGWSIAVPDTGALYGQALALPVRLAVGADGAKIVAAEVFLSFDATVMRLDSVTTQQGDWSLVHHVVLGQTAGLDTLKAVLATGGAGWVEAQTLFTMHYTLMDARIPAVGLLRLEHLLLNDGQPVVTPVHGQVRRLGVDGVLTVQPEQLAVPDSIAVEVVDADADVDAGLVDRLMVRLTTSADSEALVLDEIAPNSGVFTGRIAVDQGVVVTADGVVQMDSSAVRICYTDSLDATGQTVERCADVVQHNGTSGELSSTAVVQPGDTLRVRLADADLNVDPQQQETVAVQVLAGASGDTLDLTLTEVGTDAGVFFGGIRLDSDAVASGDTVFVLYTDGRDAAGQLVERQAQTRVIGLFGDADGNGRVQAFDAAKVLEHALSAVLVGMDLLAANVDLLAPAGPVTPFDAALILQHRVGLLQRFPVQEEAAENHPQARVDDGAPKEEGVTEYALDVRENSGYLTVWAEQRLGIVSGEIILAGIGQAQVEMAPGLGHFMHAVRAEGETVRLVFAGAAPLHNPGPLVRVYGLEPVAKPTLLRADFNDGRIIGRVAGPSLVQPAGPVLHANYPNPFNPETTLGFTLTEPGHVRLTVFNAAGQRVRGLSDAPWPTGTHQVQWDGRDQDGVAVGSGVYFYRLQAGTQSRIRRMLLIR